MKKSRTRKHSERSITKKIKETISEFGGDPFDINTGQCRDFAERIKNISKKKGIKLVHHITNNPDESHCFIKYGKKIL